MRTWTQEARQAQAAAIRRWQPWKNSTGPKTANGKKRAAINATRHGLYSKNMSEIMAILKRQRRYMKAAVQVYCPPRNLERTIIIPNLAAEGEAILYEFCRIPDLIDIPRPRKNRPSPVIVPHSPV